MHASAPRTVAVAPMIDWSDRHFRYFMRLISRHVWLYTEMVTTGAILHGDRERLLGFDPAEAPLALQLGGSEPGDLARCARIGAQWGYDEINLNVGCPSERVQSGAFGACLMNEPTLVADCVQAMRNAVDIPVTVKHRIGINQVEHYEFLSDFVGTVAEAGCSTFIVHARNAILQGLSPKQNREIPPLKYDYVYRLKQDFPRLTILINGGIVHWDAVDQHLQHTDGVMMGRAAYHDPYHFAGVDRRYFHDTRRVPDRAELALAMMAYAERTLRQPGQRLNHIVRHLLGLYHGQPGARTWRRTLSDSKQLKGASARLIETTLRQVEQEAASMAGEIA